MATRYWLGAAVAIPEVWTISITGTWAEDDTLLISINGKDLTLTAGTAVTIDDIGAAMVAMINGDSAVGTETRSALGSAVGEFAKLTASYVTADDNLLITGQSTGRPVGTVTVTATTAGTGAAAVDGAAASTSGTGPHDWDNIDNWNEDDTPDNADEVVFDHQASSSCLYGLDQTSLTIADFSYTGGFKHSVGLPQVNKDTTDLPYDEHLTTHLSLAAATILDIDGSGAGIIKMDMASTACACTVHGSGAVVNADIPTILLNINHAASTLDVLGGEVGLCFLSGTTGQVTTFSCGGDDSSSLVIGDSVTLGAGTISSGTVSCKSSATTINVNGGSYTQEKATTITTLNISGGTFTDMSTGTYTTVAMTGGTYDKSKDNRTKTVTNFIIYARCSLTDPTGAITATNGFDIYPALQDVTIDFPTRKTYTLSAI